MKRSIAAMLAAVMLMVGCGCACAEKSNAISEIFLERLQIMELAYRVMPEKFKTGYILQTYYLYEMYMHAKGFEGIQDLIDLESDGMYIDTLELSAKMTGKGLCLLATKEPDRFYSGWLDGEVSDEECAKELMKLVTAVMEADKKAKEREAE